MRYSSIMAATPRRNATFVDLEALGDEVSAEIIHGAIVEKASPTMEHGRAQLGLGGILNRRYDRRPGGRWPGGWWFGTEVDVEYEMHELYRHDLVGWRRDRVVECPRGRPVRVRPDWVCELLSPSNEKRDLIDKMRVPARRKCAGRLDRQPGGEHAVDRVAGRGAGAPFDAVSGHT